MLDQLIELTTVPTEPEAQTRWLECADAIHYLRQSLFSEDLVIYAALSTVYVHAVFVDTAKVEPVDVSDLLNWNFGLQSGWSVSVRFSEPPEFSICPPCDHTFTKTFEQAEPLIFSRCFDGLARDQRNYYELDQVFAQINDLHFVEERQAYCRLDDNGDIDEIVKIRDVRGPKRGFDGTVITAKRAVLDEWMLLQNVRLVRTFDFSRYIALGMAKWPENTKFTSDQDLYYRGAAHASCGYVRGCQVVRPVATVDALDRRFRIPGTSPDNRRHVSFIAHDWRNRCVREISTDPKTTANYFIESDLPYELSPAFFNAQVLAKYKSDTEKYTIDDRSISCRGTWHLKTFDLNDQGQVHTYIVYLRNLPYAEQLYWKSFNEEPKGPISKRALKTDFEGSWDVEPDPLSRIKSTLKSWQSEHRSWWQPISETAFEKVNPTFSGSVTEWIGDICNLQQLVIEGFDGSWLRGALKAGGHEPDAKLGSLRLLNQALVAAGCDSDRAFMIMKPLFALQTFRTCLGAHRSGADAAKTKKDVVAEFGSYPNHFSAICAESAESLEAIGQILPGLER